MIFIQGEFLNVRLLTPHLEQTKSPFLRSFYTPFQYSFLIPVKFVLFLLKHRLK